MIVLAILLTAFVLPLVVYAPEPESLRDVEKPKLTQRVKAAAGTLALGIALIVIASATFTPNGLAIDSMMEEIFGLSRDGVLVKGRVFQLITSSFIHINLFHLASNLFALMLLAVYERRVGYRRLLVVFLIASFVSSLGDLLLLPSDVVSMGASAGICGIAAAYFLDYEETTGLDWIKGVVVVLILVGLYSFADTATAERLIGRVNWAAHLSGAFAGAAYVRVFPKRMAAPLASRRAGNSCSR